MIALISLFHANSNKTNNIQSDRQHKVMYAQCNPDGYKFILLDELIEVKRTDNALILDQHQIIFNGATHHCKSRKGWFICCS